MATDMAKRPRFVIDVSDELRRAVAIRAARQGRRTNELLQEVLEREFAAELRDARRHTKTEDEK